MGSNLFYLKPSTDLLFVIQSTLITEADIGSRQKWLIKGSSIYSWIFAKNVQKIRCTLFNVQLLHNPHNSCGVAIELINGRFYKSSQERGLPSMKTSIARQLLGINRRFYNQFAQSFSISRMSMHKGILQSLPGISPLGHMVDIGCGDGRVGHHVLDHAENLGLSSYLGADFSEALIRQRQQPALLDSKKISFTQIDISKPAWERPLLSRAFDSAVCFSTLHHIPGPRRRLRVLSGLRKILRHGGKCVISVWQLSHVARLQKKIRSWESLGIDPRNLEPNDFLVDWKMGGEGVRYVHEFSEEELLHLSNLGGFIVRDSFRSDGQSGDMGLYVVLEAP